MSPSAITGKAAVLKSRLPFVGLRKAGENDFCNVLAATESVPRDTDEGRRTQNREPREREEDSHGDGFSARRYLQDVISGKDLGKRTRDRASDVDEKREEIMPDPFQQSC